eukprot:scaffold42224_cov37-Cyclotella_meneghiniana.AAC.2
MGDGQWASAGTGSAQHPTHKQMHNTHTHRAVMCHVLLLQPGHTIPNHSLNNMTICSMVVQHLYQDVEFNSPFLIVYIGTSLFSVFLPLRMGYEKLWGGLLCCGGDDGEVVIIPSRRYSPLRHHEPIIVADDSLEEDGIITSNLYSDVIHPEDCSFDPSNAIDMQKQQ